MRIAVAGTGYVGLSMAILLSQHNEVKAVDIVQSKYSPKFIKLMLQQEIAPVEGWNYLRGMGKIHQGALVIFPEEWENSFGHNCLENGVTKLRFDKDKRSSVKVAAYGWTVGLDLPTADTVKKAIESLRAEIA